MPIEYCDYSHDIDTLYKSNTNFINIKSILKESSSKQPKPVT